MGGNFLGFNSFVLSVVGVCGGFINLEDLLAQSSKRLIGGRVCVCAFVRVSLHML